MSIAGVNGAEPFVVETRQLLDPVLVRLLEEEWAELEAVLGVQVELRDEVPEGRCGWVVQLDPALDRVELAWDRRSQRLMSRLPDLTLAGAAVDLLHTLAHAAGPVVADDACSTRVEVLNRIEAEVRHVWPSFRLRGIDPDRWAGLRPATDLPSDLFVDAVQRWVAALGDAHTAVHRLPRPAHHPPYAGALTSRGLVLAHVPDDSDAARQGIGPGWVVDVEDPARWLATTGATPRMHAGIAARRVLAMVDAERTFAAIGPGGTRRTWTEHARPRPEVVLDEESATIRLTGFVAGTAQRVRAALDALAGRGTVTIDLRGNVGGRLVEATEVRRMFLRAPTLLGAVRFTDGRGGLAAPVPVRDEPDDVRWPGEVRFLVDATTYSAAEDLVWGLQGLPHVRVAGATTGGGSGRPHTRRLTQHLSLTVSTALTFDRTGRCVEANGFTPDSP